MRQQSLTSTAGMLGRIATRLRLSPDVFVLLYILLLYGIVIPLTIQKRWSVDTQQREGYGFRQRPYQQRHIQVQQSVSTFKEENCAKISDCHCGGELNFQRRIIPHKLAIAGIVRDSLSSLPRMRRYIETIGNLFEDYRVIIIENDSSDGTKEFLNAWSSEAERCGKKVIVDSHQMSSNYKHLQKRPNHEFLARMRNRYLDIVLSIDFADFDMIAVIDLDLKRIDVPGFLKAVNDWIAPNMNMTTWRLHGDEQSNWWRDLAMELNPQKDKSTSVSIPHWAGITANGVTQDGKYFDIFALRVEPSLRWNPGNGCLFRTSRGRELIQKHQIPIEHVSYHDPTSTLPTPLYIPVASAFGGLAIYQMAAVRGCAMRKASVPWMPAKRSWKGRVFGTPCSLCPGHLVRGCEATTTFQRSTREK